jgi:hypothetical protein
MKFVFLLGGFAGLLITGGASYAAHHQADRILFDGAVGCLVGALLFRWFWTVLVRGIREIILQRHAAATAAAAAAANAPAKSK